MDFNIERVHKDREGYWKKNIKMDIILNSKFENFGFQSK